MAEVIIKNFRDKGKRISGIYEIVNTVNGRRYVGSAVNIGGRWCEHKSHLSRGIHRSKYLQNSWDKYGADSFRFSLLLVCDPEYLLMYEQSVIDSLKPEYNILRIAGSSIGTKHSTETRAKIAAKATGRPWTDEAKAKLSATLTGRKLSDKHAATLIGNKRAAGQQFTAERKAKISAFMTGRPSPKSPEHRAKIAAALRGVPHSAERRIKQSQAQTGLKRNPYRLSEAETDRRRQHAKKYLAPKPGHKLSPQTIQRMAATLRGRKLSPEHKENIGRGLLLAWSSGKRTKKTSPA